MAKKPANNRIICPKCGTSDVRYRVKTNSFICRHCGNKWKRNKED